MPRQLHHARHAPWKASKELCQRFARSPTGDISEQKDSVVGDGPDKGHLSNAYKNVCEGFVSVYEARQGFTSVKFTIIQFYEYPFNISKEHVQTVYCF